MQDKKQLQKAIIYFFILNIIALLFFLKLHQKYIFKPWFLVLIILYFFILFFAWSKKIYVYSMGIRYSVHDAVSLALVFISNPITSASVVGISFLIMELYQLLSIIYLRKKNSDRRNTRPFRYVSFFTNFTNPARFFIGTALAGIVYSSLCPEGQLVISSWGNVIAVILASLVLAVFCNTEFIYLHGFFIMGYKPVEVLKQLSYLLILNFIVFVPLAVLIAFLYQNRQYYALFLVFPPFYVLYKFYNNYYNIIKQAEGTVETLARTIDERDHYTYGHSERVAAYAKVIAEEMKIDKHDIINIERAGRIHDIGKVIIPDSILLKKGKLTDDEYFKMKEHPLMTSGMNDRFKRLRQHIPFDIATFHHERVDGKGYVFGKTTETIPIESRILSVADTYDAMTSDRSYRKRLNEEKVLEELRNARGSQLDPDVIDAFFKAYEKGEIKKVSDSWLEKEKIYQKKLLAQKISSKLRVIEALK